MSEQHDLYPQPEAAPAPPVRRSRRGLWIGLSALVVAAAAYGGAAVYLSGHAPKGTTVAGVAVGGLDAAGARSALTAAAEKASAQPITLTTSKGKAELDATKAGLAADVGATVDKLYGFTLNPVDLWRRFSGGGVMPMVVTSDKAAFTSALDGVRGALDVPPTEGTLAFKGGKVAAEDPVPGTGVDAEGTLAAVLQQWPGKNTVVAVTRDVAPKVSAEAFQKVRTEVADVVVSGPVTVEAGDKKIVLEPKDFAGLVSFAPSGDTLAAKVDDAKLVTLVTAAAEKAGAIKDAKDAVVRFTGETPSITPSADGVGLDDKSIVSEVTKAITTTDRQVTVASAPLKADFTTEKAKATLPKEVISTFTTYYQCCPPRVTNIKRAAQVMNGTYIPPGKRFSMNGILGERNAAKGYLPAAGIMNGVLKPSYGGGISQVSTTVFNAAFFAGVKLVDWTPHSYYISRYPEGREATIDWPSQLDNVWENNLDGGILVLVKATDTSVTVTFKGTKKYDIKATSSGRYNIVQPRPIVSTAPDCMPQPAGVGFDITYGRIFYQGGKEVKREKYFTHYIPENPVTCK